jgi:4-diphosphocytidyl-2-C-methyl-D-erythritol kinase
MPDDRKQMLKIEAPAKINLTLEVLWKRPDGYHEIRSVIQTINFSDSFQITPGNTIHFVSNMPDWSPEQSLVSKAINLLQKTTGCHQGVEIETVKRIPLMSGLGGDSSDAAAILYGLNQFWELRIPHNILLELAGQLGSDVPFFLSGGTALLEGRGEIITSLCAIPHQWVILIIPNLPRLPGKTKRAYDMLKHSHYTDGEITEKLVADLKAGKKITNSQLFNTFENIVFSPGAELTAYKNHILKIGAPNIHLAGTGPALYIMLQGKPQAEDLLTRLKNQGMEAYLTETRNTL